MTEEIQKDLIKEEEDILRQAKIAQEEKKLEDLKEQGKL